MSSKKQKCETLSSPKAEDVVEAAAEDISKITILPPEIILRILSNLSHGDVLWCRLVSTKWNDVIRMDPNFLKKSLIRVCAKFSEWKDLGDFLQNSNVKWKHLHLIDVNYFGTGRASFPVEIPIYLREEVQTLKISHSKMPWTGYQQILTQFPSLKELKIKRAELFEPSVPTEGEKELVTVNLLQSEFETILNKLTSLGISDCEIAVMNIFLNQFQKHLNCLTTFKIKANAHDDLSVLWSHGADFYKALFEVIHANSKSLKKLEMTIFGLVPAPGLIENNFENVIRRLIESPTASSSLNLDTIYLLYEISPDKLDQEALVQFLKMNKNLKRVCLPGTTSEYLGNLEARKTLVQMLMTALPKDIVQVKVPTTSYFQAPHNGSLINFFEKLEVVQIHHAGSPSHGLLHRFTSSRVQKFGNSRLENVEDVRRLTDSFPNLSHLKATIDATILSKAILQHIYEHMRLLISLDLTFFECWVTDSDVTGIRPSHCKILQRSNPKSLGVMEVPAEEMDGHPLSSLQRLEGLTIECKGMRMTDVGLCFGFRFPRLKHLNLRNTGNRSRITLVGLNYLADFNKSLERVTLDKIVRKGGMYYGDQTKEIEEFKLRLDRCKFFRMNNITLSEHAYWNIYNVDSNSSSSEDDGALSDFPNSSDSHNDHNHSSDDLLNTSSSEKESDDTSDDDAP